MNKGILILTRTLGDVVLGNVLAKNIKLQFPDIELDYVVEENYKPLIESSPYIKNIHIVKSTFEEWDDILKFIVNGMYDKVFVAQQTSGIDNSWHQTSKYGKSHLLSFYAKRCGIKIIDPKLELNISDKLINDSINKLSHPIVAIHTTTLADVKNWSKFVELVKVLKEQNFSVIQLGSNTDVKIEGVDLKPDLSLKEIMQFLNEKLCDIFIGLDSGLSYVAAAFNIPVVALYGATIPETSGVYGDTVSIIFSDNLDECKKVRNNIRCHGIVDGKCQFKAKCIDRISVDQVMLRIHEVFAKRSEHG